jgi:hypothetical protein
MDTEQTTEQQLLAEAKKQTAALESIAESVWCGPLSPVSRS